MHTIRPLGLDWIQLGTGNYRAITMRRWKGLARFLKPKRDELAALIKGEGLSISALSCHGNCLHPDKAFAKANQEVQTNMILLAEKLGVKTIIDFSGCPGSDPKAQKPSWVTCPWPPDFL